MPLVYQQNINDTTKIAVWHITEEEDFFLKQVPLQRSITHWHKRLQHLAGRSLLKEMYPHFPIELIQIADTRKPFLEDEAYHFSIAHSGDHAAAMVSTEYRVGVDVEWMNPKLGQISSKFLSDSEREEARGKMEEHEWVTLSWSVKEAVFKWWGSGGVDFKKGIKIVAVKGTKKGIVHCIFRDEIKLEVHFAHLRDNYLAWVLTRH